MKKLKNRNNKICKMLAIGFSGAEVARKYNITRNRVYAIRNINKEVINSMSKTFKEKIENMIEND